MTLVGADTGEVVEVEVLPAGAIPPTVEAWASRIEAHLADAAEGVLAAGRDLIQAKAELRHGEFLPLLKRLKMGPSTAQRMMAAARNPVLSNAARAQYLPASWMTLYELSKVPETRLLAALEAGEVTPTMERSAAVALRKPPKSPEPAVRAADWAAVEGWHHCPVAGLVDQKGVEPGSVDVFITDPPYPFEFLSCYSDLSQTAAKLLKPGGLCVAMAGQSYLPAVIEKMAQGGLRYHWIISYLTPGGQAVQLWDRNVNTFWKPVLVYANGTYEGEWFGDVAKSDVNDNDKDHHHWGQSESGMADLIRRVSKPDDLICDPFLGGGTTAVVAAQLGRRVIGSDIDKTALDTARRRFE